MCWWLSWLLIVDTFTTQHLLLLPSFLILPSKSVLHDPDFNKNSFLEEFFFFNSEQWLSRRTMRHGETEQSVFRWKKGCDPPGSGVRSLFSKLGTFSLVFEKLLISRPHGFLHLSLVQKSHSQPKETLFQNTKNKNLSGLNT